MTDITELAQREKFEAWFEGAEALPWGYLKNRRTSDSAYQDPDITDMWVAWKAAGAELVEALEKAQQRIVELESRLSTPVLLPKTNGYWTKEEKAYEEAITLAKRQIRLAGFRCEGDE